MLKISRAFGAGFKVEDFDRIGSGRDPEAERRRYPGVDFKRHHAVLFVENQLDIVATLRAKCVMNGAASIDHGWIGVGRRADRYAPFDLDLDRDNGVKIGTCDPPPS